ncbi:hypothetical protein [Vibrio europaeus]|uniref:hypothetical protein n=1 Tax=Vibrio europaeus TaxID=300876 RepID=UPI00148D3A0F|nr:hypothetical protein [Vibrio europaeus]MDC5821615.1 hypothetical protein [Vibrio europaeus]MDC5853082.1 hypothetical protein [Vibrio europaeus]MDC5868613.1 hypothetical protein [Vibrio europaeus]NOH23818.1 hypothetical protein [Vibrio europaeus]
MRIVYRADTRPPSTIFSVGFKPRFKGGIQIQDGGQMIGGISTSKDITIAMKYASLYGGYVYALYTDDKSVDVVEELYKKGKHAALPNAYTQMEIACNAIPPNQIVMARKVTCDEDKNMTWEGVFETNPKHGQKQDSEPMFKTANYLFNLNMSFKAPE